MSTGWQRGYTGDAQSQASSFPAGGLGSHLVDYSQAVPNAPHGDPVQEVARLRAQRNDARRVIVQRDAEIASLKNQLTAQLNLNEKQKQTIKEHGNKKNRGPTETHHKSRVDMSTSTSFNYQAGQQRPPMGFLPPPLPPVGMTSSHHQISPARPGTAFQHPPPAFLPPPPAPTYNTRGNHKSVAPSESGPPAFLAPPPAPTYNTKGNHKSVAPSESGPYGRRGSHQPVVLYGTSTSSPSKRESVQPPASRRGSIQPSAAPYQQHPLPLRPPSVVTSQALVIHDPSSSAVNWSNQFSTFFTLTEAWSRNFCNVPTPADSLPLSLLHSLKTHSTTTNAPILLSSSGTRYFLVAALVNHWMTSDIFSFHIVRGFSPHYDTILQADVQRQDAHTASVSSNIRLRRAFAKALVDDVSEMMAERDFHLFFDNVVKTRTDTFWHNIQPLLAPSAIRPQAYAELLHVFREALRIGFLMLATPAQFDIDYPTARPVTWFDARCMHPLNLSPPDSPSRLQRHGRKIKLAVTPDIGMVDLLARGLERKLVVRSGVLV